MILKKMCFGNLLQKCTPWTPLVFCLIFFGTLSVSAALDVIKPGDSRGGTMRSLESIAALQHPRQFQRRHRLNMLFPLLLRISSKLAQLIPMAMAAVGLTFSMALFAKKALVFSVAAFVMMLYQANKKKKSNPKLEGDYTHYYIIGHDHFMSPYHRHQHATYPPHGAKFSFYNAYGSDR